MDTIRESIEAAVAYLHRHPDEARAADTPATAREEDGLRVRVEGPEGRLLITDMPGSVGGKESAPSRGWMLRAAHAACDATLIAMRAAQEGIVLTTLEVTVNSESDDRGHLGMDDSVRAGPLSTHVGYRLGAEGTPADRLRGLVDWAEAPSPVGDAVRRSSSVTVYIEILPEP
jgi:uncharacterized OsmC-like protein